LCRLTLANIDRITGHVEVLKGKGGKSRTVRAERSTVRAIWRYLGTRPEDLPDSAPLFASTADDGQEEESFLSRYAVLRLLKRLGERAKVKDVNIHKFRHTFGRPLGRLVNISLDMARYQERVSSPWRSRKAKHSGLVSFQGT
jgi:integrase